MKLDQRDFLVGGGEGNKKMTVPIFWSCSTLTKTILPKVHVPVTIVDVTISFGRFSSSDLDFNADLECVCEVAPVKPLREKVTSVIVPLSNAPKKKNHSVA